MKLKTTFQFNFVLSVIFSTLFLFADFQLNNAIHNFLNASEEADQFEDNINTLLRLLVDRETGQRGYLLTRDEEFLQPYVEAEAEINTILELIKPKIDVSEFELLTLLISERATYFEDSFKLITQEQQQQQIREYVARGEGKAYMDAMRVTLLPWKEKAHQVQVDQSKKVDEALNNLNLILYIFIFFILVLNIIFLYISVYKVATPLSQVNTFLSDFSTDTNTHFSISNVGIEETDNLLRHTQHMVNTVSAVVEKEQELNVSKDRFLANMSHELRTPLNGIYGILQLLNLEDEDKQELVDIGKQSVQRLNAIISDILDIQKLSEGKVKLSPEWKNSNDIFVSLEQLYGSLATLHHIDYKVVGTETLPNQMYWDETRLSQILNNIVGNAFKFTKEGSITVQCQYEHEHLLVDISDTGIGMNEDALSYLFDRFTQADVSTTKKYGGTGLGMAITKDLVTLMGGTIAIHSTEGVGTTFSLRIPMDAKSIQKTTPIASSTTIDVKHLTILVAEDDMANRKVLKMMLEQLAHTVVIAEDGKQAFDCCQQQHFDIVLSDIQMPMMTGTELQQALLSTHPNLPIIAITGNAYDSQRNEYLAMGFDAVIAKPFQKNEVYGAINNALAKTMRV